MPKTEYVHDHDQLVTDKYQERIVQLSKEMAVDGIPHFIFVERMTDVKGFGSLVRSDNADHEPNDLLCLLNTVLQYYGEYPTPYLLRKLADVWEKEEEEDQQNEIKGIISNSLGQLLGGDIDPTFIERIMNRDGGETYEDCIQCPVLQMCENGKDIVAAGPQPKSESAKPDGQVHLPENIETFLADMEAKLSDDAKDDNSGNDDDDPE